MYTERSRTVTAIFIFLGLAGLCYAEQNSGDIDEIKGSTPTARQLLDKCTQTLDKLHTSFISKSKSHIHYDIKYLDPEVAPMNGKSEKFLLKECRTDGKRIKIITEMWYDRNHSFANSRAKRQYSSHTYDGLNRYDHSRPYNGPGSVTIFKDFDIEEYKDYIDIQFSYSDPVSQCFGYLIRDVERFDRILKRTDPKHISVSKGKLNGVSHYIIDAKTTNGRYKIWIDPEKDYNYSKAMVVRKQGDVYSGSFTVEAGTEKKAEMENYEFKKVDELWVPIKNRSKMADTLSCGGYSKANFDIELTSIVINPDHQALDSFLVNDIHNDSKARYHGVPGKEYKWEKLKNSGKLQFPTPKKVSIKNNDQPETELDRILQQHNKACEKLRSYITTFHCQQRGMGFRSDRKDLRGPKSVDRLIEVRWDGPGQRGKIIRNCWGDVGSHPQQRGIKKENKTHSSKVFDGKTWYQYSRSMRQGTKDLLTVVVDNKASLTTDNFLGHIGMCDPFFVIAKDGGLLKNDLANKKISNITLLKETAKTDGVKCHVIEAEYRNGFINTYWIAPEYDYQAVKLTSHKKAGFGDGTITVSTASKGTTVFSDFKKIDGRWIPMKITIESRMHNVQLKGYSKGENVYTRTKVILDPDHDALKSFTLEDVKDGSTVVIFKNNQRNKEKYTWKKGKVIDSEGNEVDW